MSDKIKVWAEAVDKNGEKGIFKILVSEKDSEITPKEELELMLCFVAFKKGLKIVGQISSTYV